MNTVQDVERLLPHRFPMLLVDRVLDLVPGERITAIKAVTRNEQCYRRVGQQPGASQEYPQTLLVESWGQTAGILATWPRPGDGHEAPDTTPDTGQVMLLGSLTGITFHRPVLPGDVLHHEARLDRALSDTAIFEGKTVCDGEVVMSVERMVMAFRSADQLLPSAG